MRLTSRLGPIELLAVGAGDDPRSPEGSWTRLDTLWAERPVVLVFIRHFG